MDTQLPWILDDRMPFTNGITQDAFLTLCSEKPRRMVYADGHIILKKGDLEQGSIYAFLNIPFKESFDAVFQECLSPYAFACKVNRNSKLFYPIDQSHYNRVHGFLQNHKKTVFIRSLLPCMVALDMNFVSNFDEPTEIGWHKNQAKYHRCEDSMLFLAKHLIDFISRTPPYSGASAIISVPSSKRNIASMTQLLAKQVAPRLSIQDVSAYLRFTDKHEQLKNVSIREKWNILARSGFEVSSNLSSLAGNTPVILLDDLYQSGTTIHYIAMKLQEAGLRHILGLALVKSRRDDHNVEQVQE